MIGRILSVKSTGTKRGNNFEVPIAVNELKEMATRSYVDGRLLINRTEVMLHYSDAWLKKGLKGKEACLLYTSPSPRDQRGSRMPSSA